MTKAPKKPDSRAKALAGMNKAELIKTIKQLDTRQTKLLNEIAQLRADQPLPAAPANDGVPAYVVIRAKASEELPPHSSEAERLPPNRFPWEGDK